MLSKPQEPDAVRWNIKVSKKTDRTLRLFLGKRGIEHRDFSKFIEEAVRWHVFHRTVEEIKLRNAKTHPKQLEGLIDDAVREVRTRYRTKAKSRKS